MAGGIAGGPATPAMRRGPAPRPGPGMFKGFGNVAKGGLIDMALAGRNVAQRAQARMHPPTWTGRNIQIQHHTPTRTVYSNSNRNVVNTSTRTSNVRSGRNVKLGGGPVLKGGGGGGGGGINGGTFNQIVKSALKLYKSPIAANKSLIDPAAILGPLQGSYIDPNQVGQDAGMAQQANIDALTGNVGTIKAQNAQDLQDIQDWYNQAQGTAASGAQNNAAALAQQLAGLGSADQGLLNAIGGAANPAAPGIINSAAIGNAGLAGIGQAQSGFDNSMKSILALDQADQLRNEQTAGTNRLTDVLNAIAGAKTQQASDVANAKDQALQNLFGEKNTVANLASNLQGNLFNEKMGVRQERLSELGGLSNTILGAALAGPQIAQAKLGNAQARAALQGQKIQNKGLQAQIKAYTGKANATGGGGAYWQDAPLSVTNGLRSQILSPGGEYIGSGGGLKVPPPAVKAQLTRQFAELGFKNSPALKREINMLTQTIVTRRAVAAWDAKHGTHYLRTGGY